MRGEERKHVEGDVVLGVQHKVRGDQRPHTGHHWCSGHALGRDNMWR